MINLSARPWTTTASRESLRATTCTSVKTNRRVQVGLNKVTFASPSKHVGAAPFPLLQHLRSKKDGHFCPSSTNRQVVLISATSSNAASRKRVILIGLASPKTFRSS